MDPAGAMRSALPPDRPYNLYESSHVEILPPVFTLAKMKAIEFGAEGSLSFRHCFINPHRERLYSPWDDVTLYHGPDRLLHCVCTTPAGTCVRHHVAESEFCHPIRVGRQRETPSRPAHFLENATCHIGFLPQTFTHGSPEGGEAEPEGGFQTGGRRRARRDDFYMRSTSTEGEVSRFSLRASTRSLSLECGGGGEREKNSRPLDVLDIGSRGLRRHVGEVYLVKPLVAFVVANEEGRRNVWKILAIAADDPMADSLHDVADVHQKLPGTLELIREWLRTAVCTEPGMRAGGLLIRGLGGDCDIREWGGLRRRGSGCLPCEKGVGMPGCKEFGGCL